MTAKELRAKRAGVIQNSRKLIDDSEKRGAWSAEDETSYKALDTEITNLGVQIERLEKQEKLEYDVANRVVNDPTNIRGTSPGSAVGDQKPEEDTGIIPANEARALAVQGWFMRNSSDDDVREQFTERHARAQKQTGIGRNQKMLNVPSPVMGSNPHSPNGPLESIGNYKRIRQQLRQRLAWDGAQGNYVNVNPLTTQQLAGGGALIPEGFSASFETALLAYGYMLQTSDVMTTPGANPLPWPTANDTGNKGRRLNQNAAVNNTGANIAYPAFGAVMFYGYKYTSDEILVPFELIRDNAVGLVEWLGEALGIRIGRAENDDWTNGTGAAQPKGIVVCATSGKTAASATAIKWDEVIDLEHSVDPAYRSNPGVGYMCHDGIIQSLRKLKDGEGRYLWQQSANSGEPDRLNNRPLTRNQSMQASVATGTKTLLFGDLSKYKIRRVGSLRMYRLVERYRDNDQDAFLGFEEADGNLIDAGTHPVKYLSQP